MKTFYRGFLIREDIRSICYTVIGMRPDRPELATVGTYTEAIKLLDRLFLEASDPNHIGTPLLETAPLNHYQRRT